MSGNPITLVIRAAFICWALFVGYRFFLQFRSGQVPIANFGTPNIVRRQEQPFKFWAIALFCYAILAAMVVLSIFLPAS
ncbi:MAG: hypothetical protein ACTHJR_17635 [Sphingomonas sp.]|uniref:hypothetical protein n=1 Tax=Sphingomonas sp. TaxID=28214 RepID=UPI003F7FF09B